MAFTVIQGSATNGAARASSTSTVYTEAVALTSTPAVGNFVTVALYSNRGYPTTTNIQSVTLGASGGGSVTMYLLDDGQSSVGGPYLLVYGAYISVAPNGSNLVVKWKNSGLGGTTTLSMALMEFSGAASVSTLANAVKHRFGGGLIDSGSPGYVASYVSAFGGTLTYSGNGSELTISATTWGAGGNPIPIVGSLITIQGSSTSALNNVPMLVKSVSGGTIVVNSTYSGSATERNASVAIYGSIVQQSNYLSGFGASQYFTIAFGLLQWPGTSRIMTSYSTQQQPWVGAFLQNATTSGTRSRIGSAGCTIPTSGTFTIPCSSTTGASSTGSLILHTQNGNIVVTYTSVTSNTSFNGCSVNTPPASSLSVAGYSYLMYPTSTTQTLLGVFPDASVYNPSVLGGLTNGDSTPTSTSVAPYFTVALASGGSATGSIVLMGGYATSGTYANINGIGLVNGTGGSNSPFGGIWTFVPSTRGLTPENASAVETLVARALRVVARTKVAQAVRVHGSKALRVVAWIRVGRAVQVLASKAVKTVARSRFASAVQVRTSSALKTLSHSRVAQAVQIGASRAVRIVSRLRAAKAVFVQAGRISRGIGLLAQIVQIGASQVTRAVFSRRSASAVQLVSAQVTRTRHYGRFGSAVNSYAISTSKRRTWVRRASAVAVGLASTLKTIVYRSHPGTVVGSWETANVVGSFKTGNVTSAIEIANVVGSFKTALLSIETETATLYANAEPLQES